MSENKVALEKVTIPVGNEIVGVFYFETREEAEKFAKDVVAFSTAVKNGKDDDKEKVAKKYARTKAYANFFKDRYSCCIGPICRCRCVRVHFLISAEETLRSGVEMEK